jgi:glycosyltransferase involved in cell wall biosynthesis
LTVDVALDVTPLVGPRSGVGYFVAEILDAITGADGVRLVPYALSLRARRGAVHGLPPGTRMLPLPAGAAVTVWGRVDQPDAERWLRPAVVVHGTNYVVPPCRGAGAVVTVHDCSFARFPELCSPAVRRLVPALRRAVARGAWVHTPSRFVAEEAADILGTERVVAVPHGVPRLALAAAPLSGLVGDSPFMLALGTLEPRKNVRRLVEAFAAVADHHPRLQLLVAGADGPARPGVEAARAALPPAVARRVRLAGYVDDRTRATLLTKASVFAYPSLYEGFGFPVLEAMAAGTPVVAGAAGAIPEVAGDGALLVDPTDTDAIAGAICRVLEDPGLANELVRAGHRQAAGYSWRRAAEGLVDLYRQAAPS